MDPFSHHAPRFPAISHRRPHPQAGDVPVLLVFLTLTVLLLGATLLTIIALRTLRGARDIVASSQALYAADTAVEFGLLHYHWGRDANNDGDVCTTASGAGFAGQSTVVFDLLISGDPPPTGSCPKPEEVAGGSRALCVEASGSARGGGVRRRVTSDLFVPALGNPCHR